MLVRRKVLVNNSIQNRNITREERDKPVRILKRRIIPDEATPVLSSPLSTEVTTISSLPQNKPFTLPQNKPFTVNETVAAKPDAVKRCKNFVFLLNVADILFSVLSLFTIVSWKQGPCTSTTGTNGTCYSSNECSNLGGTASGTCASGFGVCCLVTVTCGGTTSVNGTYFQNPGFPSTYNRLTLCWCQNNIINCIVSVWVLVAWPLTSAPLMSAN